MAHRKSRRIPKYRLHRGSGQAMVMLNGRAHYLGRHNIPHSKERYDRLVRPMASQRP